MELKTAGWSFCEPQFGEFDASVSSPHGGDRNFRKKTDRGFEFLGQYSVSPIAGECAFAAAIQERL
jgi:hypothetical protein